MRKTMTAYFCDFCGKSTDDSDVMVAGPNGAAICSGCVKIARDVTDDHQRSLDSTGQERAARHAGRGGMADRFASWLVGLSITWWLAERGFMPCRLIPLCIARSVGVPVCWAHLVGRESINTSHDAGAHMELDEGCRHA